MRYNYKYFGADILLQHKGRIFWRTVESCRMQRGMYEDHKIFLTVLRPLDKKCGIAESKN